jgi:hypothetical protein
MHSAACASHKTKAETTAANPTTSREHFKNFIPSATRVKVPPQQSSMTDTASTATGDRSPAPECEASSHDAYGTPRKLFGEFFGVIADTMRDILGAERSPEIDAAWRKLLGEVDQVIAQVA